MGLKRQCWAVPGGTHCRNHDPALAERRRLNGCARHKEPPKTILRTALGTDGRYHKPEHVRLVASGGHAVAGKPPTLTKAQQRAQKAAELAERAAKLLEGAEPGKPELRGIALRVLKAVAVYGGDSPQVAAAKALLDYVAPEKGAGDDLPPPMQGLAEALNGEAVTRQ